MRVLTTILVVPHIAQFHGRRTTSLLGGGFGFSFTSFTVERRRVEEAEVDPRMKYPRHRDVNVGDIDEGHLVVVVVGVVVVLVMVLVVLLVVVLVLAVLLAVVLVLVLLVLVVVHLVQVVVHLVQVLAYEAEGGNGARPDGPLVGGRGGGLGAGGGGSGRCNGLGQPRKPASGRPAGRSRSHHPQLLLLLLWRSLLRLRQRLRRC